MTWKYSEHYFPHVEGHIFLGHEKRGACTITLTPAASMTQKELNRHGKEICRAVNARKRKKN